MNKETLLWVAFAFLIIGIAFFGEYRQYGGTIAHDYPATINAADPGARTSDAAQVLIDKRIKYEPSWIAIGIPGRVQAYPPMMLVAVASLSSMSGIEIFDLYFFLGVLVFAGIAIGWFLYFRKQWNKPWLAAITAILLAYPLEQSYHYLLKIGMYGNFFVALFLPFILILFDRMVKDASWKNIAAFGIVAGMQFLTYPSTSVLFVGFLLLYALIVHRKTLGLKKIIIAGIIYSLVAMPYIPLFYQTFVALKQAAGAFTLKDPVTFTFPSFEPGVYLSNMLHPVLYILALLGMFASLRKPSLRIPAVVSLFYIIVTMALPVFGIGEYYTTLRTRYLLFIFLYPLAAIGITTAAQALSQSVPQLRSIDKNKIFAVVVGVLAILSILAVRALPTEAGGLFNKEKYQDFLWVRQNTPADSVILCFGCQQFEGFVTQRIVLQPLYWEEDVIQKIALLAQGNASDSMLQTEYTGHSEGFPVQTGLFTYKLAKGPMYASYDSRDICASDYFIIMNHPQLGPAFMEIGKNLLGKNATEIRQSQYMIVLKNTNKGGKCI